MANMARFKDFKRAENNDSAHRWLVSYADYMTLMFALFVVLYASSIVKEDSYNVLFESLGKLFESRQVVAEKQLSVLETEVLQQNQLHESEKGLSESENEAKTVNEIDDLSNDIDNVNTSPLVALNNALHRVLIQLTENGLAQLEQQDDWLTIELSSGMLFPSGSATASPAASVIIREVSKILLAVDNLIEIRGYTDGQPINNELFASNWELSAARAANITNLMEQFGVNQKRLAIKANGSNNPIASNDTAQGRAKNRRVVIAVSKFAYVEESELTQQSQEPPLLQRKISDSIEGNLPDHDQIQVIKLDNGGILITTRDQSGDDRASNNNND